MGATLRDVTKGPKASPLVFFGVAIAVALSIFRVGQKLDFSSTPRPPPPPAPCLIEAAEGYVLLDRVDSLENCGARLEAVYLESGRPVTGAYGGMNVFADRAGIDTSLAHGPRETLITPPMRQWIDSTLVKLMTARDQRPGMQIGVVRLSSR